MKFINFNKYLLEKFMFGYDIDKLLVLSMVTFNQVKIFMIITQGIELLYMLVSLTSN